IHCYRDSIDETSQTAFTKKILLSLRNCIAYHFTKYLVAICTQVATDTSHAGAEGNAACSYKRRGFYKRTNPFVISGLNNLGRRINMVFQKQLLKNFWIHLSSCYSITHFW